MAEKTAKTTKNALVDNAPFEAPSFSVSDPAMRTLWICAEAFNGPGRWRQEWVCD